MEVAESRFKDARIKQLESNSPPPAGPGSEVSTVTDLDALPLEEKANKQWQKDPKLRAEFGSLSTYIAYLKADQKGLVRNGASLRRLLNFVSLRATIFGAKPRLCGGGASG